MLSGHGWLNFGRSGHKAHGCLEEKPVVEPLRNCLHEQRARNALGGHALYVLRDGVLVVGVELRVEDLHDA